MQPVHSVFGRDTDGAHEQGGLLFDDNLNKLCELSLRVVILLFCGVRFETWKYWRALTFVFRALPPT
jgi:hypothetical protein